MSNKGFALIQMLFLLPALFTTTILFGALGLSLIQYSRTVHICRTGLLETQSLLGRNLENLIKLNPQAKSLRLERARADAAASIPGPQLPAAQAYQKIVIAKQLALRAQQMAIIGRAKAEGASKILELKYRLGSAMTNFPRPGLAVTPTPALNLSPDYTPIIYFERAQSLRISLKISLNPRRRIPIQLPEILTSCSATLFKEKQKWRPKLGEGRLSSSSFL